ncbi:MAG: alkaline phosphatase family protein [Bacteroidia bacterium]|nr:alkaline phosphatase family protein [Bacteroidia bacterium]
METIKTSKLNQVIALFIGSIFFITSAYAQKPKLIIGIVVDQMRVDYLYRYQSKFGEGGFKRLMNNGFFNKNANYNYVLTYTAPGHASIYTGSTPRFHGIISNDWYDKRNGKNVYCTQDDNVQTVGSNSEAGKMSPRNMMTNTIGDELRLATNLKSKVIGISQKDRSSILPAGHIANAAYWFDGDNGIFISSTFYMKQLPAWVTSFNEKKLADKYLSQDWTTLLPLASYTESIADDNPYEGLFKGETKPVFPHKLAELKEKNKGYNIIRSTPFGNSLTKDFALEALKNEDLGKDDITDFLTVSFSSTDYVGHKYGINAVETEDTYLRLDKDLEELLNYVEKNIGKENVLIFLTADHGGAHNAAYLESLRMPAGYVQPKVIADSVKNYMKKIYGDTLVLSYTNQQFFLDHKALTNKKLNLREVTEKIALYTQQLDGVANAYTVFDIRNASGSNDIALSRIYMGYNDKRSGDVAVNYLPAYLDFHKTGTTHGATYTYDTHIPLLWYGWKIKVGESYESVNITDIAPTVASFLDIAFPNGCVGKPILNLTK